MTKNSKLKHIIRSEIKKQLSTNGQINESAGTDAAEHVLQVRKALNDLDRSGLFRDLIKKTKKVDPEMADWAESIHEEFYDMMDELYGLGNELSMR